MAERLDESHPRLAADIGRGLLRVDEHPTPYLDSSGAMYRVTLDGPSGPEVSYVGCSAHELVELHIGQSGQIERFFRHTGLDLGTVELRRALIIDVVRLSQAVTVLSSFSELIDELSAAGHEDRQLRARLERDYGGLIATPTPSGQAPWRVVVFGVRGESLMRFDVELLSSGEVHIRETRLEERLPIPMWQ